MTEQITSEEFDALLIKTRLKESAATWARAVLVDGRGYADVGSEHGVTRQMVYQAVSRLLAASKSPEIYTYKGPPESFVAIDAIVDEHKGRKMLTQKQFDELVAMSRLEEQSIALVKGVLLDGLTNIELAKTHGVARHLVWQAAQRLMKRFDPSVETTRVYSGPPEMFAAIDALASPETKTKKK